MKQIDVTTLGWAISEEHAAEVAARFVNLTPHVIRLLADDGCEVRVAAVIPPSGKVARVDYQPGVRLEWKEWAREVVCRSAPVATGYNGLPAYEEGKTLIVSQLTALALKGLGRHDVFTTSTQPHEMVRDANGQPWGVFALEQAPQ